MTVHNHGIDPSCRERKVGECLLKPGAVVLDLSDTVGTPALYGPWLRKLADADKEGETLRATLARQIADQIEAQTKPPRIPEPGRYGVVVASFSGDSRSEWVNEGKHWVGLDNTIVVVWDDLIDPTLVREGL